MSSIYRRTSCPGPSSPPSFARHSARLDREGGRKVLEGQGNYARTITLMLVE